MQVTAIIFTSPQENQLLTIGFAISSLHQWFICIHLSYSHLTTSRSLFLFPFNTNSLLNQHREAVYSPRLHSDYDRPTIIFCTTFAYPYSKFAIHGTTSASIGLPVLQSIGLRCTVALGRDGKFCRSVNLLISMLMPHDISEIKLFVKVSRTKS
jgi:hypothetical protein